MTVALFALYMGILEKAGGSDSVHGIHRHSESVDDHRSFAANRLSQSFSVPEILVICGIMQVIALLPPRRTFGCYAR